MTDGCLPTEGKASVCSVCLTRHPRDHREGGQGETGMVEGDPSFKTT